MEEPIAIFELGINHMGSIARARRMIEELAKQGATALSVQALISPGRYSRDTIWIEKMRPFCISLDEITSLIRYAKSFDIRMGITILDPNDVAPLAAAGASFFKILSSDLTYTQLHIAAVATQLPVYLATGASTFEEISHAIGLIRIRHERADIRLIHTILEVPTPTSHINLSAIDFLKEKTGLPVAYGQHSDVLLAMPAAIAAGAESIFIYVAEEFSPDLPDSLHAISCSTAKDVLTMLTQVRSMMGPRERVLGEAETAVRQKIRRTVVAARAILAGEVLAPDMINYKRPEDGVAAWDTDRLMGCVVEQDYALDDTISI